MEGPLGWSTIINFHPWGDRSDECPLGEGLLYSLGEGLLYSTLAKYGYLVNMVNKVVR